MPKPRRPQGSKPNNSLRDIKRANEAKHNAELSPSTTESTPEAKDLEFQKDLEYLLNDEEAVAVVSNQQTYATSIGISEIEISVVANDDGKRKKSKHSKRPHRPKQVSVAEIIGDIGELDFSSDDEDVSKPDPKPTGSAGSASQKHSRRSKKKLTGESAQQDFPEDVGVENVPTSKVQLSQQNSENAVVNAYGSINGGPLDGKANTGSNSKKESNLNSKKTKKSKSKRASRSDLENKGTEKGGDNKEILSRHETEPRPNSKHKSKHRKELPSLRSKELVKETDLEAIPLPQNPESIQQPESVEHYENGVKKSKERTKSSKKKKIKSKNDAKKSNASVDTLQLAEIAPEKSSKSEILQTAGDVSKGNRLPKSVNIAEKRNSLTSELETKQSHGDHLTPAQSGTPESLSQDKETEQVSASSSRMSRGSNDRPSSSNSVSSVFGVTLKSLKSSLSKSEQLPAVSPVKTIIGVSHRQILTADLSDVKLKTIMNAPSMSKYAANSLKFVKKYETEVFDNFDLKREFLTLCFNVALYESEGFKKSVGHFPDILENFGHYDELNLATTHTAITASEKHLHRNTLDYSMFAYFGHILIWALHLQRKARIRPFVNEYGISISPDEVKMKIGGRHLWDKLFRELKGMNSKRWKHVLKFRNMFALEEDQFLVILRFMKISDIP
ncbi:hypothetical protein KGF57_001697 [Candida theae]|uniref:Uncharacterized protein n=1 Tax=Candida theae TaxID=1198502 RepID=A0AAD5BGK6_9ASCO|nr:uncharacterized protein KGF57_001697 [Candida theae]KAI5961572.1 hypothetical protein KGF57_001697 [Candida theae]